MICGFCRTAIEGKYYEIEKVFYHAVCYRDHVARRCQYCDEPLTGTYYKDGWGLYYCEACKNRWDGCIYCSRLAIDPGAYAHLPTPDRPHCSECARLAVISPAVAHAKLATGIQWMSHAGLTVPRPTRLVMELQERGEINPWSSEDDPLRLGYARIRPRRPDGSLLPGSQPDGVVLQIGLPEPHFDAVTVHELTHIWLAAVGVRKGLTDSDEEGFCELISYNYLRDLGTRQAHFWAERIAENQHPVYGGGFRRLHRIATDIGFDQLVYILRRTGRMPDAA